MVNRVFCYSREVAKQNKCYFTLFHFVLALFAISFIGLILLGILLYWIQSPFIGICFFLTLILGPTYLVTYRTRMIANHFAFATDDQGRIFQVGSLALNTPFLIGEVSAPLLDSTISKLIGSTSQLSYMNQIERLMSNPEIVAKAIESAPNVSGIYVWEILHVHDYSIHKHYLKLICDFRVFGTETIEHQYILKVCKSYQCFDELKDLLLQLLPHQNLSKGEKNVL